MAHQKARIVVEDKLFAIVTWVSRFCGFAPVRFKKIRSYMIIYISRLWLIIGFVFSIIILTGYISSTISLLLDDTAYPDNKSGRNIFGTLLLGNLTTTLLLCVSGVFYGVNRMKSLMYCVDQTQKITKRIGNNFEFNVKQWRLFILCLIFFFISWGLGIFTVWFYGQWKITPHYFRYLEYVSLHMMIFQFIVVAMSIKSAFKVVNKSLQEELTKINLKCVINDTEESEIFLKPTDVKIPIKSINAAIDLIGMTDQLYPNIEIMQRMKIAQKIRQITHSFVSTNDVLRNLKSSESVILLLQLVLLSLDLAAAIFNVLNTFHVNDSSFSSFEMNLIKIMQITWLVYYISKIVLLIETCYRTHEEVSNTRSLVSLLMCYVTSKADPLRDEIDDFFKQLILNDLSYSAMGICNIERPLVSTIIGSVTTILVLSYEF